MDKIKINNQVVSMRKYVKQAKAHIINKLVKEIKVLTSKKGTENQIAKNMRKKERRIEEMNIVKKIPLDEISRKALMQLKDWKSVLKTRTSSLEDRAFSYLANFGPIQAQVKKFVDENPKLLNLLPEYFEEWNAKKSNPLYQEAKKITALELKLKKKKERQLKRNENRSKEKLSTKYKDKKKIDRNKKKNKDTPENNKNEDTPENIKNEDEILLQNDSGSLKLANDNSDFEDSLENNEVNSENKNFNEKCNAVKTEKNKDMAILRLDELDDDEFESCKSDSDEEIDKQNSEKPNVKKDSFFLSGDESFDDDEQNEYNNKNITHNNFINSSINKNHGKKFSDNRYEQKNYERDFSHEQSQKTFRRNNRSFINNSHHQKPHNQFNKRQRKELHPSDPKKRNFSPKDKFSQNRSSKFEKSNKWNTKPIVSHNAQNNFKNTTSKSHTDFSKKEPGLHPSWEAKRKLNQQTSQILPFQGKKIKFE